MERAGKKSLISFAALLLAGMLAACGAASAGSSAVRSVDSGVQDAGESSPEQESMQQEKREALQVSEDAVPEPEETESAPEIENNGGYFVRVGEKIYFRRYGENTLEKSALWGNFLDYGGEYGAVSAMMAYDPATGETEEVFEDFGYGRIFAGDGGFYCKRAGDGYGDEAYWIAGDGEGVIELGTGEPLGISRGRDGLLYLTLRDQDPDTAGDLFLVSGMQETARAVRDAQESLEYCGMAGEYAIYLVCNTEEGSNMLYSLSGKDGTAVCLGEMPIDKGEFMYPYLEAEQMLSDEKGIYLVASNYAGTGHFRAYSLVVSAVPGEQDSLQLIEFADASTGEGTEAALPKLFLTGPGEPQVVPGVPGEVTLSEVTYGDLVYFDSPYSAVRLIMDFLPETDYEEPFQTFLQTAEVIGDSAYIITADAERNEEEDIGWRMAYDLAGMTWMRIPIEDGLREEGSSEAEVIASAEDLAGGAEGGYHEVLLSDAVGTWKMYSYVSGDSYGLAEEENIEYWLVIKEDGTADYYPRVNGVETLGAEGMEISGTQGGALYFGFEDAETGWNSFEITDCNEDEMHVLYVYHFGDGSTGVMESVYQRTEG